MNLNSMTRSEQDAMYMAKAREIAQRSGDLTTKVGCVIVTPNGKILLRGWNDLPHGVRDLPERRERPAKYLWTAHSERNAVYAAAREGIALKGCRIYLPWFPCSGCAEAIVQSGIVEVIGIKPDTSDPKWGADFEVATAMFDEAGVAVRFVDEVSVKTR